MSIQSNRRSWKTSWQVTLFLLVAFSFLAGCLPGRETSPPPPWRYADLRILAAPGAGQDSHQLVGLYTRRYRSDIQIRLDLLEYEPQDEFDLYLAIDVKPGGSEQSHHLPVDAQAGLNWDLLLIIPPSGPFDVLDSTGTSLESMRLRVARNPSLDMLTVSFDHKAVGESFRIQAFMTESGSPRLASSLGPVRSDARPPLRLPVMLAFWNTYPAYTPSQALRRLDGAHTGPSSDRHGLRGLLDAVESAGFPVVLLDLKIPTSLSALDYAGALDRVRRLASQGLLILPDAVPLHSGSGSFGSQPGWVLARSAIKAGQVWESFSIPPSPFLYSTTHPDRWLAGLPGEISQHRLIFSNPAAAAWPGDEQDRPTLEVGLQEPGRPYDLNLPVARWQASTVVDLSSLSVDLRESTQATYAGPPVEIRRSLLEAAADPNRNRFVMLGGDLAQTSWGNPTAASQTLGYLMSRPWLQPVSAVDLVYASSMALDPVPVTHGTHVGAVTPSSPDNAIADSSHFREQVHALLLDELKRSAENAASELAWQAYETLLGPQILPHPLLASLRANYFGQIGHLLAASRWEESGLQAYCTSTDEQNLCITGRDVDWDGEEEYVMATQEFFLLFEARGGYLATAFWRDPGGAHQVIAPSSQFIVGLGDPMSWDPGKGVAGDPAQYRGAFSDVPAGFSTPAWNPYVVEIGTDSLSFLAPDRSLKKSFSVSPGGFTATYTTSTMQTIQIPLAVDPALRFTPDWGNRYTGKPITGGWLWGIQDGVRVQIRSSEEMSLRAFSDSDEFMGQPEDPDFDFPPGHFLPFPMALAEIIAGGEFSIEISMAAP